MLQTPPPEPRTLGGGRFRIERELGAGGMGTVFEAFDVIREERVALKTLTRLDAQSIYLLKHEYRSMADVVHPNLVGLGELVNEGSLYFFTMDLIDGVSFKKYVRGDLERVLARLRRTVPQLVEGVRAIHRAGKLHLDLKPSNVLVRPDGHLFVLDFGLVSDQRGGGAGKTVTTDIAGTPNYMSPEQARGEPLDPRSDWYAVGAMVYRAITGHRPFEGEPLELLQAKQKNVRPLQPRSPVSCATGSALEIAMRLLDPDPAMRPDPDELMAALEAPRRTASGSDSSFERTAFVGRSAELSVLSRAYALAQRGTSTLAFVHGPSGIGKTFLVRRFTEDVAAKEDAIVLRSRCYERESLPFKALDGIVDLISRHLRQLPSIEAASLLPRHIKALTRLFPVLDRVDVVRDLLAPQLPDDPEALRRLAMSGLKDLLGAMAAAQPVIVTIDDLQWGDLDSARMIRDVLAASDAPPILLIVTYRTNDVASSDCIQFLLGEDFESTMTEELKLDGMSEAELTELGRSILSEHEGFDPAHVVREAEGSPYFVAELAHLLRTGAATAPGLTWKEAFLGRCERMTVLERDLLEAVAVAARPVSRRVVVEATSAGSEAAIGLRDLTSWSFIKTRPSRERADDELLECYHDRIRETLKERIHPDRLRHWHHRLALAYERTEVGLPEVVAHHYAECGQRRRASELALVAAEQASRAMAFNRAASLYDMALQYGNLEPNRARVFMRLRAEALARSGRDADAARAFMAVADLYVGPRSAQFRQRAAQHILRSGRVVQGMEEMADTLERFGLAPLESTEAHFVANLELNNQLHARGLEFEPKGLRDIDPSDLERQDVAWVLAVSWAAVDGARGGYFALRCLLDALELGEPHRVARALCLYVVNWAAIGRPRSKTIARILEVAGGIEAELKDGETSAWLSYARAAAKFWQGMHREAVPELRRAEQLWKLHLPWALRELGTLRAYLMTSLYMVGELDTMRQLLAPMMEEADERDDINLSTWIAGTCWPVDLLEGDVKAAKDRIRRAKRRWANQTGARFDYPNWMLEIASANLDLYEGEPQRAWDRLSEVWPEVMGLTGVVRVAHAISIEVRARVALALWRINKDDALLSSVERHAQELEELGLECVELPALLLRAGVAGARGLEAERRSCLERAVALSDSRRGEGTRALIARAALQGRAPAERSARSRYEPERWARLFMP